MTSVGIGLDATELAEFLAAQPTGILTTLRANGWPVALPVWFVAVDGAIFVTTYEGTAKLARIRRDPRASFLVESGRVWTELKAVTMPVTVEVADEAEAGRARAALAEKHPPAVDVPRDRLPAATRRHYDRPSVILKLVPAGEPVSWDNAKLRLLPESQPET